MLITAKDNPKIKELRKLYSSRRERLKQGLFVIEGVRGCRDALRDLEDIRAVFYTEGALGSLDLTLPDRVSEDRRFLITDELAEKISDTHSSQGIFVVAKRLDKPFEAAKLKADGKYLILAELQDPGNLGTMIRTADAVGLDGVVLAGSCVDLYNPKTVRSAVGSMPRVDIFIEKDSRQVLEGFARRGIKTAAAVIEGGEEIRRFDFSRGCAVVIGNEGRGLDDETVRLCSHKVTISMSGHIDSLNAAAAATIFLWEMTKQ